MKTLLLYKNQIGYIIYFSNTKSTVKNLAVQVLMKSESEDNRTSTHITFKELL